ncbi:MAG: DUF6259 domain-containing protein [Terriglobia bacterium]
MSKEHQIGRREFLGTGLTTLGGMSLLKASDSAPEKSPPEASAADPQGPRGWWPQPYSVERDEAQGKLRLSTRYYALEHDLKQGGAISRIVYTHGRAQNLLTRPLGCSAQLRLVKKPGQVTPEQRSRENFADLADSAPSVSAEKPGKWEVVTVESRLLNKAGEDSGITVRTSYTYRWGYIKIHKEFRFPPSGIQIRALSALSTAFDPSLTHYGYCPNPEDIFTASGFSPSHSFWGEVRAGTGFEAPFATRYVPCHLIWANPGIEGIEWFASDDLAQWSYQLTGEVGTGHCVIQAGVNPESVEVSIDPLNFSPGYNLYRGGYINAAGSYAFDYYVGMPILEGHATNPWFERSYGANRGNFVSAEQIKHNAELGVVTMTLHNDGNSNHDNLYWHDGSWPPYPPADMKKMAEVIENCHKYGIKTVPYFSCEELNQVTEAFKEHAEEWGAKPDDQGNLRPNYNYGALMCLKSGWHSYLKFCVDRVLKHYPFDGVYYDWIQPVYCNNPLHVGKSSNGVSGAKGLGAFAFSPTGHWALDEYVELLEWTRERVGPDKLILLHTSNSPFMALENFANAVVTMEWGYGKLSTVVPPPATLPLEWNLVGARSRAVTEYGNIAPAAPPEIHQLFYLTAMITGIATFPASDGVLKLFKLLKPLGNLEQYQFEDWRNKAVRLSGAKCYSAVYSRPGEAYIVLANFQPASREVNCTVHLQALKPPLSSIRSAELVNAGSRESVNAGALTARGARIDLPGAGARLLHLQS